MIDRPMPNSENIKEIIQKCAAIIQDGGKVAVLTGAGISAESGIKTFRDNNGLWENHRIEEVASPVAYARDPEMVTRFYNLRRQQLFEVGPNPAHKALAKLEEALGDRFTLVTQNVDDLHERAGSEAPLHMHGELRKVRCVECEKVLYWEKKVEQDDRCEECGGMLRPHIVWFGEMPFYMTDKIPAALNCQLFLSVGTSGVVYPAAQFVSLASKLGALSIEINLEAAENSWAFDHHIHGKAGGILPDFVEGVLKEI